MTSTKEYPNFYIFSTEQDKIFWTISEVAERLNLEPYVLRFWEKKFKKLQPTQKTAGTRHYKINDIRLIERIRDLLYKEGYTIDGAIKALNKKSTNTTAKQNFKSDTSEEETNETSFSKESENTQQINTAKTLLSEIKKTNVIKEQLIDIIDDIEQIEILLK
ncbi:MAG: MerR family transcriptional regulator [Rickettsiales bacterium]|jgi:DNA-binding transcriptional MerR regulator|nr:MerR family transcriptional regulator [Rickettsiales bacterium]